MNVSILTMLATPYVLFGLLAGLAYRKVRRHRRELAEQQAASNTRGVSLPSE